MIVVLTRSAAKEIEDLPETYYFRIKNSILTLAENPFPHGAKKLSRPRIVPY